MKIRTRQNVSLWTSTILVVLIGATLILALWRVTVLIESTKANSELVKILVDLRFITSDYRNRRGEREKNQWHEKFSDLERLLKAKGASASAEKPLLDRITRETGNLRSLFVLFADQEAGQNGAAQSREESSERDARIYSRMRALLVDTLHEANRLVLVEQEQIEAAQRWATALVLIFIAISAATLAENWYWQRRRILNPIAMLQQGTEIIGEGHLEHKIGIDSRDEIGELAGSFNRMVVKLREAREKLEAANRELESFSYSVSHDLRAPLRAIDGFSRLVVDRHGLELGSEARRYLEKVRANTQQMGALIDDLLAFSRMGRQELVPQRVDTLDIVRQCLHTLSAEHKEKRAAIVTGDLPDCEGDPILLKQVWMNLLANALKFSSKRETPSVEIGSRAENGERVYFVRDNGVGFDMRYADKLFGVFQRLHGAGEFPGTGVGLALAQRIVARHGGRIWAEAQPDQGATFSFTL